MVTIKQRFNKKRTVLTINIFVLVGLLIVAIVAGTFLSNVKFVSSLFNKDLSGCAEVINVSQEMIGKANYWRDLAQKDAKDLWACQLEMKRVASNYNDLLASKTAVNATS